MSKMYRKFFKKISQIPEYVKIFFAMIEIVPFILHVLVGFYITNRMNTSTKMFTFFIRIHYIHRFLNLEMQF